MRKEKKVIVKYPLETHNDFTKDLLLWTKRFLATKALELFETSKKNTVDDIIEIKERILNEKSDIEEVKNTCNDLINQGIGSFKTYVAGVIKFYHYAANLRDFIKEIDDKLLDGFEKSIDLAPSSIRLYSNMAISLVEYIERHNKEEYKFGITFESLRVKKSKPKVYDSMDAEEFVHFSKMLPSYKYKSEFEKCRNILICRILLFGGLKPSELQELKIGESFIVDKKDVKLVLPNRKDEQNRQIEIKLPRSKFIKYFNSYCKLKKDNKDGLMFYGITDNDVPISTQQIALIVRTLLEHAKIERRDMTPTLLRVSLVVYLYNHRKDGKQVPPLFIKNLLGVRSLEDVHRMVGFHEASAVQITDVFLDDVI